MSVVHQLRMNVPPSEVLSHLEKRLGRTGDAFQDLRRSSGGQSVAVGIWEQYFMRAGNRCGLTMVADDLAADGSTLVSIVVTGSSQGLIFNIDWGAAGDYAAEAVRLLTELAESRGGLLPLGDQEPGTG